MKTFEKQQTCSWNTNKAAIHGPKNSFVNSAENSDNIYTSYFHATTCSIEYLESGSYWQHIMLP